MADPASRLALGTVQFGLPYGIGNRLGQVTRQEAQRILQLAAGSGIDTLDTAHAYGDSEQRLGEIGIRNWSAVSKVPAVPADCDNVSRWIAEVANQSLHRMNIGRLYGLLLHRPQQLLEKNGSQIYSALSQLKNERLVEKIGISVYAPSELDSLCSRFKFDLVQAPFNVLDRRLIDTGWLSRLTRQGTEVHVRSVFLQGLLLMRPNERPRKFNRWTPIWSEWNLWLEQAGLTPLQACVRHALSVAEISKVIIGVDSVAQLNEILGALAGPLRPAPAKLRTEDLELLNPAVWDMLD